MFTKPTPAWILAGGGFLTACAGSVNAVGFLGVHHRALSHLSGPITVLSTELAAGELTLAARAFLVVVSFFVGCILSGFIVRQSVLKLGRRYGFVLVLEAILLVVAVRFLKTGDIAGDCCAAAACGLQNAMATSYSGAVIRTTHMTGIVTDLGLACGHLLRGNKVELPRMRLHAVLLAGFFLGGILGTIGYQRIGYDTLLFPAAACGITGLAYTIFKHIDRQRRNRIAPPTPST